MNTIQKRWAQNQPGKLQKPTWWQRKINIMNRNKEPTWSTPNNELKWTDNSKENIETKEHNNAYKNLHENSNDAVEFVHKNTKRHTISVCKSTAQASHFSDDAH